MPSLLLIPSSSGQVPIAFPFLLFSFLTRLVWFSSRGSLEEKECLRGGSVLFVVVGFIPILGSSSEYVRHQLEQNPKPGPQTVNHRLGTVRCCYRFHTRQEVPAGKVHFQRRYTRRSPLGYGRPRPAVAWGLRLKQDRRVIVPLSSEEVAKFWQPCC